MAASLPILRADPRTGDGTIISHSRQTSRRASTPFWHDRGRPEDMMRRQEVPRRGPATVNALAVRPTASTTHWHGHTSPHELSAMSHDDHNDSIAERSLGSEELPRSKPRDSKMNPFSRTWSTISSALRDLEPIWARRQKEAATLQWSRPYTPSCYSTQTVDNGSTTSLAMGWDSNHIVNRLSDIVEESWKGRSILKTPEPAVLIQPTRSNVAPYRGDKSDWDIEKGSMI